MTQWTAPYDEGPEPPDLLDGFRALGQVFGEVGKAVANYGRQNGKLLIGQQLHEAMINEKLHEAMVNAGLTAEQLDLITTLCKSYEPDRQQVPRKGNHGPRRGRQFDSRGRRRW